MDLARGQVEGTARQSDDPGHTDSIPPKDLYQGISMTTLAKMTHDESIWIAAVLSQQLLHQIKGEKEQAPTDHPAMTHDPSPSGPNEANHPTKKTQREDEKAPQGNNEGTQLGQLTEPQPARLFIIAPGNPDQNDQGQEAPSPQNLEGQIPKKPTEAATRIDRDEELACPQSTPANMNENETKPEVHTTLESDSRCGKNQQEKEQTAPARQTSLPPSLPQGGNQDSQQHPPPELQVIQVDSPSEHRRPSGMEDAEMPPKAPPPKPPPHPSQSNHF